MVKRVVVLAASLLVLTAPLPASALLQISSSTDGGGIIFARDNQIVNTCGSPAVGPCQIPDLDPTIGSLATGAYTTAGGDVSVQVSVQTSNTATGPGTLNRLDSTGTQVTNNSTTTAHTFAVAISDINFNGPALTAGTTGAAQWSVLTSPADFGGSTITMRWFDDPNNVQGAFTPSPIQPGTLLDLFTDAAGPNNPDSFSHNATFNVNDPGLFSMSLQFDGLLGAGVRLTGREMTEVKPRAAVPNPLSLLLLGTGLLFVRKLGGKR
jgi:hypothetical protein